MELKIYDKANNLRLTASPNTSSSVTEEVGGECSVSASFTHTEYIPLDVDDYIELEGVRYKVKSRYRPKQKNTQTYEYSVKFYAPIHDAEDTLMLIQEGGTTSEFSYDGGPREHLQLWIDNMNRRAGGNLWSIGTVIIAENKTIDYRNVKCWDAAFGSNGIAATFETEMWADGYVINLCKAERGEMVELGYLQGLTNLAQEDNGEVKFFTRLFPLGSTRNINATKYGYSRLQLPDRSLYVDKNVDLYGVKEETEETAFSEIFPKYIGTISSVRSEEKENEEGRKYTVYYFKDNGMNWNPKDYEIPDLDYMLKFQTGELAGRGTDGSFQAAWHEDTREWEIINVYPDDTTQIPGGAIIPTPGDQYIPWNFAMPQEYITEAEQEYKQAVDDYLNTYSFDPNKYIGTTDRNYIEKNHTPLRIGWNVRLLSEQYFGTTGGYKDTRITKVQRKLNDLCQATITCSDEVGTGWKSSVDNSLNSLRYEVAKQAEKKQIDVLKTSDSKTPSDYNVFSALRSRAEFISKKFNDTVIGIITFLQAAIFRAGAVFGKDGFASGLTGYGAKIDENGNVEAESLTSRRFIETPELRYNRVDVKVGDKWRAPGAGIIESVDTESKICTLKLEEGEIGAVAVGDICMGIFHSLTSSDNATEDTDDSRGNRTFAGFCTVYFTITEVIGSRNEQFKYQLRPVSERWKFSFDPFSQMNFVAYGSFTREDRQTSVYETRTYTRHLWKQNTWEMGVANIAKQSGDLSNLNIFGLNMEGYSEYTNSVYFTGTITQVKPDGTPVKTANDRGSWVNNTQYYYYDRVSHNGCIWLCVNEDGTNTEPSESNPNWLLQVSKGVNGQDGTSFRILGSKNDESELPQSGNEIGDGYLIQGHLWVWSGTEWNDAGVIQGPAGQSVTNMGGWYEGMHVPYLGVVRMGNATFMCVVEEGTDNPPYYTLLDKDSNRLKTESGYILTGEINNAEYQLIAADGTNGKDGLDGVAGKDGKDGKTYYTWIRYADDAEGNGISNDPTGKAYIGFAYNKESPLESNNPEDYVWSDIKGEQGVKGDKGEDGTQYYTWIAYSDNADGNPMYQQPNDNTKYIGIAVNKITETEGTDPSEYTWSKFRGEDGKDGLNGADGVNGKDGTSIVWQGEFASAPTNPQNGWAYKNTTDKKSYVYQDGSWYQMTIDGVDGKNGENGLSIVWKGDLSEAPANPQMNWAYRDTDNGRVYIYNGNAWELMVVDGTDGTNGADGQNGLSVYITYNDSEAEPSAPTGDGTTNGWHTNATSTTIWMSQKVAASSSDGTWGKPIKVKGEQGIAGEKGDGFTLMGQWYDGMVVPYMGVVNMGGNSFVAKVATTNPPMWTLKDNSGNRLKTESGYILTGEVNTFEYDLLAEKGDKGDKGEQGIQGEKGDKGDDGAEGKQGIQGCVVRDSEWAIGTEYRNDSNITDGSLEVRYVDVVLVKNNNVETGWDAYRCKLTHVSSTSITYENTSYWEKFSANVGTIFTSLIIAKNAKINFLQGNQLTIQQDDGTITAGISGSNEGEEIRFWAGSESPDDAPFRVDKKGVTYASDAHIEGEVTATSGSVGGFEIGEGRLGISDGMQGGKDGMYLYSDLLGFNSGDRQTLIGAYSLLGREELGYFQSTGNGYSPNYGIRFNISGGSQNFAFSGNGDGVLNGMVTGYKVWYIASSKSNLISILNKIENTTLIYTCIHQNSYISLPTSGAIELALSNSQGQDFGVMFTIISMPQGSYSSRVYGKSSDVTTTTVPQLFNQSGSVVDYLALNKGATLRFYLVRQNGIYSAFQC